jgi:DNA modification methylase
VIEPYWTDGKATLYHGDCLAVLRELPSESVHCCVTSPPYLGLRDYGTATWEGGDPACDHRPPDEAGKTNKPTAGQREHAGRFAGANCWKCGARRIDQQIGLEPTPAEYVAKLVEVFREVRRVLHPSGVLWLNLGDSYNAYNGNRGASTSFQAATEEACPALPSGHGLTCKSLKPKDLLGIPWSVALALRDDGWWLRSDIIWHKPNAMPSSVEDRPTTSHEYVFLLSKSSKYFYDSLAIAEPVAQQSAERAKYAFRTSERDAGQEAASIGSNTRTRKGLREGFELPPTRNIRSVWTIPSHAYPKAHFATFPPELAKRCILAGTSAEGCCLKCLAPYERITERTQVKRDRPNDRTTRHAQGNGVNSCGNTVAGVDVKTTGWRPTCQCNAGVQPCVVIDPFAGSGTTLAVARQNGCRSIGIELSEEYCRLVIERLKQRVLI